MATMQIFSYRKEKMTGNQANQNEIPLIFVLLVVLDLNTE
jgi:hypothetical protein